MSRGIRGVVVTTVCVTAAAMLANGAFFWTIPLVLGLIAEALAPRRRRWLIWVGAAFLTVIILPMEIRILPEFLTSRMDWMEAILLALWIASMCLIVWCDVVLYVDALKTRIHTVPQRRFRALGDSIVWISAVCFTVYSFWGILGSVRA